MKVIIDRNIPYIKGRLEPYFEVVYRKGSEIGPEDVKDADAMIIRTRTICNENLLKGSRVKFIASATIGEDHVDLKYCKDAGIDVFFAKGCNSRGVMQYVFTALSYLHRKTGYDFRDKTLGVVGVGNVGSKVAWMGQFLGMKVLCCDTPKAHRRFPEMDLSDYRIIHDGLTYVSLDELLKRSDIVTVHVPLERNSEFPTYRMADTSFFLRMKPESVFINSSRGEVVDDEALKAAIRSRLSHVVLDVWNHEPGIDRDLLAMADLATPHIAGYSVQGKVNGSNMVLNALGRFFDIEELAKADLYKDQGIDRPSVIANPFADKLADAEDRFSELMLKHFPVGELDASLRKEDADFEKLRSEYTLRNEILIPEMK